MIYLEDFHFVQNIYQLWMCQCVELFILLRSVYSSKWDPQVDLVVGINKQYLKYPEDALEHIEDLIFAILSEYWSVQYIRRSFGSLKRAIKDLFHHISFSINWRISILKFHFLKFELNFRRTKIYLKEYSQTCLINHM